MLHNWPLKPRVMGACGCLGRDVHRFWRESMRCIMRREHAVNIHDILHADALSRRVWSRACLLHRWFWCTANCCGGSWKLHEG